MSYTEDVKPGTTIRAGLFIIGFITAAIALIFLCFGHRGHDFPSDSAGGAMANAAESIAFSLSVAVAVGVGSVMMVVAVLLSIREAIIATQRARPSP